LVSLVGATGYKEYNTYLGKVQKILLTKCITPIKQNLKFMAVDGDRYKFLRFKKVFGGYEKKKKYIKLNAFKRRGMVVCV